MKNWIVVVVVVIIIIIIIINIFIIVIVCKTKFSILIGSPRAYLSRGITWVPITSVRFELFVIGYPGDFTSITRAFMASFAMFPTIFKTYVKRHRRFPP